MISHGGDSSGSVTVSLVKMVSQRSAHHGSRLLNFVPVKMFHMSLHRFFPETLPRNKCVKAMNK